METDQMQKSTKKQKIHHKVFANFSLPTKTKEIWREREETEEEKRWYQIEQRQQKIEKTEPLWSKYCKTKYET